MICVIGSEKIYKIRTERLRELGAPFANEVFLEIIFVIYILDYVSCFKAVIFYCIIL